MTTFSGRWLTTFGFMELHQEGDLVQGNYSSQGGAVCAVEGRLEGGRLVFRYQEPGESGEGSFELTRFGQFRGQYRPDGAANWHPWTGQREWDGIWDASFGPLRLIQEETGIVGFYEGAGSARLEGQLEGSRLVFRYQEPTVNGEGWFELSDDGMSFQGGWRTAGSPNWGEWAGRRILAQPGLTWLVVVEATWQHSLADPEYSYGVMLKEFFARLPHVAVRHRFFNDEASLQRWCRELMYLAEPAIVLISSHGTNEGVTVNGTTINTKLVIDSLRHASDIQLLHFAACLVMKEEKEGDFALRIDEKVPFPISGYTTSVDWGGSACVEFAYFEMILGKGLPPEDAALQLPLLIPFAGDETPEQSPYRALGFRFFKPGKIKPGKKESTLWASIF